MTNVIHCILLGFSILFAFYICEGNADISEDIISNIHTFRDDENNQFDFAAWKRGPGGFECARHPMREYSLLCRSDMNFIVEQWNLSKQEAAQCANGSFAIAVTIMGMKIMVIGGLLVYICRMRKKLKLYQNYTVKHPNYAKLYDDACAKKMAKALLQLGVNNNMDNDEHIKLQLE